MMIVQRGENGVEERKVVSVPRVSREGVDVCFNAWVVRKEDGGNDVCRGRSK
jgi:hypothetical protein